jgi:hypothetical protein
LSFYQNHKNTTPHKAPKITSLTSLTSFALVSYPTLIITPKSKGSLFKVTLHSSTPAKMPTAERRAQTLYDKVFQDHIIDERLDGTILLYIGMQ